MQGLFSTKEAFIDGLVSVMDIEFPMRNFTLRLFVHLLLMGAKLNQKQKD
jgi:hypothetical protein